MVPVVEVANVLYSKKTSDTPLLTIRTLLKLHWRTEDQFVITMSTCAPLSVPIVAPLKLQSM
ncbi:MAG: hypothetical protein ACD_48C00136G0001 [uncultured bacterium]|nr:MAG: hypothetical protein ACD_48C00136G0001 [uncultured bacterium]